MWNPYSDRCKVTVCIARQKFKCHSIFSNGNSGVKQYVKIGITKFFTSGLSGKRSVSDLLGAAAHPDRITRTSRQNNQNYGRRGGKVHWICFDLCIRSNKKKPKQQRKTTLAPSTFTCTVLFCFQDVVNPYPGECLQEGDGFSYPKFKEKSEQSK